MGLELFDDSVCCEFFFPRMKKWQWKDRGGDEMRIR